VSENLRDIIGSEWERIAALIGVSDPLSQLRFCPGGAGEPWFDIEGSHLDLVVHERGVEISRWRARDLDDLL
jgi:hypothetical protein